MTEKEFDFIILGNRFKVPEVEMLMPMGYYQSGQEKRRERRKEERKHGR